MTISNTIELIQEEPWRASGILRFWDVSFEGLLTEAQTVGNNKVVEILLNYLNIPKENMTLKERLSYYYLIFEKENIK